MNIWLTADYHLGHFNIISYTNRPFNSLEQMNQTIISNHNERVKPGDLVIHNGDFCFKGTPGSKPGEGIIVTAKEWESQLNGKIIFIQGNHDKNNSAKTPIQGMLVEMGGYKIWITHNPNNFNKNYPINFVGHVHDKWKFSSVETKDRGLVYLINVGIDVWNFRPVSINEILEGLAQWKKSQHN